MKPIKLTTELVQALLGAVIAGLGAFTGALTVASTSDTKALKVAGIGAGFTALTFFTNSLRSWYSQQQTGTTPEPAPVTPAGPPPAADPAAVPPMTA